MVTPVPRGQGSEYPDSDHNLNILVSAVAIKHFRSQQSP
jgi:hypothetical protein